MTHDVALQFGTYMVDLFGIPFALELLKILLFQDTEKKTEPCVCCFSVWNAVLHENDKCCICSSIAMYIFISL